MITREDYITASGKYKDRLKSPELTPEVEVNIVKLLKAVNDLFKELGLENVKISSGFRPSAANANVGGAKKSNHMIGRAIDINDPDGMIDVLFLNNMDKLKKHGLFLESPAKTKGWAHLQDKPTKNNPFIP